MNGLDNETARAVDNQFDLEPRRERTSARHPVITARWQLGRLVRLSIEAACGFIRVPSGELIYFAMQDVVTGGGGLRTGARVRFQPAGAGIPRALHVQRI